MPTHRPLQSFHKAGAYRPQVARGHHKDSLRTLQHIHIGLLNQVFVVKVCGAAYAAYQVVNAMLLGSAGGVIAFDDEHAHIAPAALCHAFFNHPLTLVCAKLWLLEWIFRQENDYLFGHGTGLANHPHVAIGNGV